MRLVAVVVASLVIAVPAFAADQVITDKKTGEKLVCKRIEKTGSRVQSERVCLPQAEWDRRNKDIQDAVRQGQVMGGTNGK
jgi:hypothetical protein